MYSLQTPEIIAAIFESLSKEVGKQLALKLFANNDDKFVLVVKRAAKLIDEKYNHELFGGNLLRKFLNPSVISKLKAILLPFDPPTMEDFREDEIYFDNLPPDFFSDVKSILLNELLSDPFFLEKVQANFDTMQIDAISADVRVAGQNIEAVKNIDNEILTLVRQIDSRLTEPAFPNPGLPPGIRYEFDENIIHIPKLLYRVHQDEPSPDSSLLMLSDIIPLEKRVLILGAAGMGKSIEMNFLASLLSAPNRSTFVIKVPMNLYTGEALEDLIAHEMPEWTLIPPENLVLMFDGLDEVHIDHFDFAIKKLVHLGQLDKYSESSILVSCRDNFYNAEFVRLYQHKRPFVVYKLKELGYQNGVNFINSQLGQRASEFLSEVTAKSLQGLFSSPFFLNYLVVLFGHNQGLPESKIDIFEKIIMYRLERDKERFSTKGIDIQKKEVLIKREMGRLALIMEMLGRNFITASEFQEIVPELQEKRILLEHTFLFDQNHKNWQFEHNNFQEYLAAKTISLLSCESIIKLIANGVDNKTVKPTWVNTISFLFLLLPKDGTLFKELLKWFTENDRELLLRFERIRVDLGTREHVFKAILEFYQGKNIITRSEKFDINDLINYVADSLDIVEYLEARISDAPSNLMLSECCMILPHLEKVQTSRQTLQRLLEGIALNPALPPHNRYSVVFALAQLGWQNQEFLASVLPFFDLERSQYDRAGFFKYLTNSGFQGTYVRAVLDLVKLGHLPRVFINSKPSRSELHLGDEAINRDAFIASINEPDGITEILEFCADSYEQLQNDFFVRDNVDQLFEKATKLFLEGNHEMFDTVLKISKAFSSHYIKDYDNYFLGFFDATETRAKACQNLYFERLTDPKAIDVLALIIDKSFIDFVIDEFKAGKFSTQHALNLRGALSWRGTQESHDYFYDLINKMSDGALLYLPSRNWAAEETIREENDLELILDKARFISELEKIYKLFGKEEISEREISELNRETRIGKALSNNICIKLLLQESVYPVPLARLVQRFDIGENWAWYQITVLLQLDVQNRTGLNPLHIECITSWVVEIFDQCKFENAFNNSTYQSRPAYLAYFVRRFDIALDKEQYSKLLWVDSSLMPVQNSQIKKEKRESLAKWISLKIGLPEVVSIFQANFVIGIQSSSIIRQYFDFIKKCGLAQFLPSMKEELKKNVITSNDFPHLTSVYLEMSGDFDLCENLIEGDIRLDESDRLRLIDKFIDLKYSNIKGLLEKRLKENQDDEAKLNYSKRLIGIGALEGLTYYKNWVEKHKTLRRLISSETIKNLPFEPALTVLFDILQLVFSVDFDRDHLMMEDQELLDAINTIGSSSPNLYQAVKSYYKTLHKTYNDQILTVWEMRLDQAFNVALTQNISLTEVIRTVDRLL